MPIEAPELPFKGPVEFDGPCFDPAYDQARLAGQLKRVFDVMNDGQWRTLEEIRVQIGARFNHADPESSISAQLRHLRKERFGSYVVERQTRGNRFYGLWEYRLLPREAL